MGLLSKLEKFLGRLGILRSLKERFRLLMLFEVIYLLCNILEYHGIQRCTHLVIRELGSLAGFMRFEHK